MTLGTLWTTLTSGIGGGTLQQVNGLATFVPNPSSPVGAGGQTITAIPSITLPTSYQIASVQLGSFPELGTFPQNALATLWTNVSGVTTSIANGIRVAISNTQATITAVQGGVNTLLHTIGLPSLPTLGDIFTIISGDIQSGLNNLFTLLHNGVAFFHGLLNNVGSILSQTGQQVAMGIQAGQSTLIQALPPGLQNFLGVAQPAPPAAVATTGFIGRTNAGDQPMFDTYTCYGPGTFVFADGPGATANVQFGPLLPGQIAQLNTDPRKRGVTDLTPPGASPVVAPSSAAAAALAQFLSWATANNIPPLLRAIESRLGVQPPQGPLYALLQGRWSDNAAIPPRSAAGTITQYKVAVGISGGDATSQIICAGTPLRRYPA